MKDFLNITFQNVLIPTTNKPTIVIITNATLIDHILTSALLNHDKDFTGIVKCGIYYIYTYIYGIHHWRIFRSSYRKLAWVGFEPTTTEFRSDALTDWAIRPWVQLALRANLYSYSSFISLFSVHVSFRSLPSSVTTFAF